MSTHPFNFDVLIDDNAWKKCGFDLYDVINNTLDNITEEIPAEIDGKELELSITLTNDTQIQDLNRDYRGKDKPTNVLSFPQIDWDSGIAEHEPFIMLGDVVVAFDTIEKEAHDQNKSFKDHFIHMLIHSVLHLFGHDHENDNEAEIMESLEIHILKQMGIENPYQNQEIMR